MIFILSKRCPECGTEKHRSKFYSHALNPDGLMRHCKACHNGVAATAATQRREKLERQWGDPTEEQIAAACEAIRAGWSDEVLAGRRVGR